MYKVEYDIKRDENGGVIIKLSDNYEDLPEHKLLFFIMSSHLLNMGKLNMDDLDNERLNEAIDLLNEIAQEINLLLLSENIEIQQKRVDIKGIVTNTVNDYDELISYDLGDQYDDEKKLKVQEGTTFYNIKNKKKYYFSDGEWLEYKEN